MAHMCNITKENGAVGASLVWLRLRILIPQKLRNMYAKISAYVNDESKVTPFCIFIPLSIPYLA